MLFSVLVPFSPARLSLALIHFLALIFCQKCLPFSLEITCSGHPSTPSIPYFSYEFDKKKLSRFITQMLTIWGHTYVVPHKKSNLFYSMYSKCK